MVSGHPVLFLQFQSPKGTFIQAHHVHGRPAERGGHDPVLQEPREPKVGDLQLDILHTKKVKINIENEKSGNTLVSGKFSLSSPGN